MHSPSSILFAHTLLAILVFIGSPAELGAAPRRSSSPPPVPPPAVAQSVRAPRGESIAIPLRIHGTRAQTLEFRIRTRPAAGTLSTIKQTAAESAVVTYTAPSDLSIKRDRFSYAVRSREGVSAAADVNITIIDRPSDLVVPDQLEFSAIAGERESTTVKITNRGGGLAEGTLEASGPWLIDRATEYRLGAGASHSFNLVFAPTGAGALRGELRYSSQPDRSTALEGQARAPMVMAPSAVTLHHLADDPVRRGDFELHNPTEAVREIVFDVNDRLHLPRRITVPPGERARVSVEMEANDVTAFSGEISASTAGYSARIAVHAAPVSALLAIEPSMIRFNRAEPDTCAEAKVAVANRGGIPAALALETRSPFSLANRQLTVPPLSSVKIPIGFSSTSEGPHRGELIIRFGTSQHRVALEGTVAATQTTPRSRSGPDRSNGDAGRFITVGASRASAPSVVPERILIESTTTTTATVEWSAALAPTDRFKAEQRQISLHGGELKIDWIDHPAFQTEKKGERMRGTFSKLTPGQPYMMRVIPMVAGTPAPALVEVQFRTAPKPPSPFRITPLRLLVAGLVVAGSVLIWQRVKGARSPL